MEAASDGYCRCCKKLFNREGKKHSVNLFGEKGLKEGIVDAVRKYGKMDIAAEDIGFLSTSICQSCYLLVKGIGEKIRKFANICQDSSLQNENGQKRTVTFTSVFIKLSIRTTTGTPAFWGKNSISPESFLATKPLTKEPEDSWYEIDYYCASTT